MKGDDSGPSEPEMLSGDPKDAKFLAGMYKAQLTSYNRQLEAFEEVKAKVYSVVLGQCLTPLRNKIEALRGFLDRE